LLVDKSAQKIDLLRKDFRSEIFRFRASVAKILKHICRIC